MNFKQWFQERVGDGAAFIGAPGPDGTGSYGDLGPESKYNGPGFNYRVPPMDGKGKDHAKKLYGLGRHMMLKKMKKQDK